MEFGDRLKQLRISNDLTREELANKLNISYSAISKYETNVRFPDQDMLMKISEVFKTTTDYLIGNSDIRNPYNEDKDKYASVDDVEEAIKVILEQPGLMLKGSILSDESKIILANAIQMGLRTAEELEKKKNEGDSNE